MRAIQVGIVATLFALLFIAASIRGDYTIEVSAQEVATACTEGAYALWADNLGGPSPAMAPTTWRIITHCQLTSSVSSATEEPRWLGTVLVFVPETAGPSIADGIVVDGRSRLESG